MNKQINITIIFLSILFIPLISRGQKNKVDIIYLKNKDTIYGTITKQIKNQILEIKKNDSIIRFYHVNEIEKRAILINDTVYETPILIRNNSGLKVILEFNKGITKNRLELKYYYGFDFILSYQFKSIYFIGLGLGLDKYTYDSFFPLFVDLRMNLSNSKSFIPFCAIDAGYGFVDLYNTKGGFMLNPTIGVKYNFNEKKSINLSLGYRMQGIPHNWSTYETIRYYDQFDLKIGIIF